MLLQGYKLLDLISAPTSLLSVFLLVGYAVYFEDTFAFTYKFLKIILISCTNDFLNYLKVRGNKISQKQVL